MKTVKNTYWLNIKSSFLTLLAGLKITWKHFLNAFKYKNRKTEGIEDDTYFDHDKGIDTLQYPSKSIPVPDTGRYRLNNEIDDCIVCDKCAKICPVNCIEIDVIKSPTEIAKASDGSSIRLYAGKFEIDMAKCMFCGLCTTVCPTECLTMTKNYDFSEFNVDNLAYEFSNLTKDMAERKQQEYVDYMAEKKAKTVKKGEVANSGETKGIKSSIPGVKAKIPGGKPTIPGAKKTKPVIKPKKKDTE